MNIRAVTVGIVTGDVNTNRHTAATVRRVAKPQMKLNSYRAPEQLAKDAAAVAEARGENVSDVIRAALERYVARNRGLITPPRKRP